MVGRESWLASAWLAGSKIAEAYPVTIATLSTNANLLKVGDKVAIAFSDNGLVVLINCSVEGSWIEGRSAFWTDRL